MMTKAALVPSINTVIPKIVALWEMSSVGLKTPVANNAHMVRNNAIAPDQKIIRLCSLKIEARTSMRTTNQIIRNVTARIDIFETSLLDYWNEFVQLRADSGHFSGQGFREVLRIDLLCYVGAAVPEKSADDSH